MYAQLGLGCWSFAPGYREEFSASDSVQTIHAAVRSGIRHFDTAQVYGKGRSEQLAGQQLRRFRRKTPREELSLATKIFVTPNLTPRGFASRFETSLNRLCTSYLDVCYIHWPIRNYDFRPLLEVLQSFREAGKLRHIGLSNFPPDMIYTLSCFCEISYVQDAYSLLWRRPEDELLPLCRSLGIRFAAYSVLAQGLLARTPYPPQDWRSSLVFCRPEVRSRLGELLDAYRLKVSSYGLTPAQAALLWAAAAKGVHTVLIGSRTKQQLLHLTEVYGQKLPEELEEYLEEFSLRCGELLPAEEGNIFCRRW